MSAALRHSGRTGIVLLTLLATACSSAAPAAPTSPPKPAATAAPPVSAASPAPAVAASPAVAPSSAASPAASPAVAASPGASAYAFPAAAGSKPQTISAASVASLVPKPEQTSIHIGDSTLEADSFALEYAKETGILQAFGFTSVESTYFDGDVKARQAMIAGQIDLMVGSAAASVTSLTTDTPFVQIAMNIDKPTDDLVSIGSVKSTADLKGKKIGISSFGTDSHASVVLALKALGVNSSDVTIVPIGGQSARVAALASGAIAAAPVDSSLEAQMQQQGMNVLIRLKTAPVTLARSGVEVPAAWAQKNPNAVEALVAASMLALHNMAVDPAAAAPGYFKWIGTGDLPTAQRQLEEYLPLALYDVRGAPEGYPALQEVLAAVDPRLASVDITKAYDYSAVDKLKANGFEKALGLPGA